MSLQVLFEGAAPLEKTREVQQLLNMGVLEVPEWAEWQLLQAPASLRVAAPLLGTALIRKGHTDLPANLLPPPPEAFKAS